MGSSDVIEQLATGLKRQGPFLFLLLLMLAAALPTGVAGFALFAPALPIVFLFAWMVERPDLLPRTTVFLCGLFQDLFFGLPLGLSGLTFLALREVAMRLQLPGRRQSLWLQWGTFALSAIASALIAWLFMSIWRGAILDPLTPLVQALAGIAFYPWVARLVRVAAPGPALPV
jgi:rod shape-determining protein MreD